MQSADLILKTVFPVFLIISIGYILKKKKKIDTAPFVDLLVYITGPALIISSISRSTLNLPDFLSIFAAAVSVILIQAAVVFMIFTLRKSKKSGLYLPAIIGNTGYIGYPVALFAYGTLGLSSAIVYDMANSLFLFSVGIYLVHHKRDFKEMFRIPLLYAVVLGLCINILDLRIPEAIFTPLDMVGSITIPLALMVLGYRLASIKVSHVSKAVSVSLFRMIGGFIAGLLIVFLFSLEGVIRNIVILQASMPSAVMTMILTHKYKKDSELVASIVLITTLLSVVTIPLILLFLAA